VKSGRLEIDSMMSGNWKFVSEAECVDEVFIYLFIYLLISKQD